ncbi:MAG: methyltransferase domain-containing protein, partial [Gammaproteobacteria bacterium]
MNSLPERDPYRLDPATARRRSESTAHSYDRSALVYREQTDRLIEHLDPVKIDPATVVDIGSATGHSTRTLSARFPRALVCGIDWARARLALAQKTAPRTYIRKARQRFVCADAHRLPLARASVDAVIAAGVPSSTNNLSGLYLELARVLRPGALLAFAAFGPDTLMELRGCWDEVDADRSQPPTRCHRFIDMHDQGDSLQRCGFGGIVMDAEKLTLTYENIDALLREIRNLGDTNATAARPAGLTHPRRLERLRSAYEKHRTCDGRLPLTFELVYAHAWRSERPVHESSIPIELA